MQFSFVDWSNLSQVTVGETSIHICRNYEDVLKVGCQGNRIKCGSPYLL